MIEAASVASPRSKSPEVFAGGTDERDVLLDLFPRRWVTVAKADRIMDGVYVVGTATTCCVGGICSYGQKLARMDASEWCKSVSPKYALSIVSVG
jgi:hypothetical protein